MHHISLWLGLQPSCWDKSLTYFLLNDLEKACFYHATAWIILYQCPISSSSFHTMWPMTMFPIHCKEWIYWLHQFINLLLYSWKQNHIQYVWDEIYILKFLWIITMWKCKDWNISDLLLIIFLFPFVSINSLSLFSSSHSSS